MSAPPPPGLSGEVPSPIHPVGSGPRRLDLRDIGGGHLVAGDATAAEVAA